MVYKQNKYDIEIFTRLVQYPVKILSVGQHYSPWFSFVFPHFTHEWNICNNEELKQNSSGSGSAGESFIPGWLLKVEEKAHVY